MKLARNVVCSQIGQPTNIYSDHIFFTTRQDKNNIEQVLESEERGIIAMVFLSWCWQFPTYKRWFRHVLFTLLSAIALLQCLHFWDVKKCFFVYMSSTPTAADMTTSLVGARNFHPAAIRRDSGSEMIAVKYLKRDVWSDLNRLWTNHGTWDMIPCFFRSSSCRYTTRLTISSHHDTLPGHLSELRHLIHRKSHVLVLQILIKIKHLIKNFKSLL